MMRYYMITNNNKATTRYEYADMYAVQGERLQMCLFKQATCQTMRPHLIYTPQTREQNNRYSWKVVTTVTNVKLIWTRVLQLQVTPERHI